MGFVFSDLDILSEVKWDILDLPFSDDNSLSINGLIQHALLV